MTMMNILLGGSADSGSSTGGMLGINSAAPQDSGEKPVFADSLSQEMQPAGQSPRTQTVAETQPVSTGRPAPSVASGADAQGNELPPAWQESASVSLNGLQLTASGLDLQEGVPMLAFGVSKQSFPWWSESGLEGERLPVLDALQMPLLTAQMGLDMSGTAASHKAISFLDSFGGPLTELTIAQQDPSAMLEMPGDMLSENLVAVNVFAPADGLSGLEELTWHSASNLLSSLSVSAERGAKAGENGLNASLQLIGDKENPMLSLGEGRRDGSGHQEGRQQFLSNAFFNNETLSLEEIPEGLESFESLTAKNIKALTTFNLTPDSATSGAEPGQRIPLSAMPLQESGSGRLNTLNLNASFHQSDWGESVSQQVMYLVNNKVNMAQINLDPPELGSLLVKIHLVHDQVSVNFSSPHSVVREALEQNIQRLQEMFQEQGVNLADVNVSDQSAQQQRRGEDGEGGSAGFDDDGELNSDEVVGGRVQAQGLVDYFV